MAVESKPAAPGHQPEVAEPVAEWDLRLYIAGQSPRSVEALSNLKRLCEEHLQGRYHIEIVDLLANPALAREDEILAVPTLVRKLPPPMQKIIGDLSNTERVLVGLQLRPARVATTRREDREPG